MSAPVVISFRGYIARRSLGSGGFGEVMLARHGASGALVAIKYLRGELLSDREFAGLFRNEAAVLAAHHRRGCPGRPARLAAGIAARAGGQGFPAATLRYAAPEQIAGAPATPASDVYAATVTCYECLTGGPPFTGT